MSTSSVNAPAGSRIQAGGRALNGHGQKRIRDIVREICGIGLGNQWTPPGMFTACMAIAACTYTTYSSPDTYYEPGSFGLFGIIISVGLTRKKKNKNAGSWELLWRPSGSKRHAGNLGEDPEAACAPNGARDPKNDWSLGLDPFKRFTGNAVGGLTQRVWRSLDPEGLATRSPRGPRECTLAEGSLCCAQRPLARSLNDLQEGTVLIRRARGRVATPFQLFDVA